LAVAESITGARGETGPAALTYSGGSVADDAGLAPMTDGIAGLGALLATPVDAAAAPLTDGVMTVGTPLTTTMESFFTPFSDAVDVVAAPFVGTVPTSEAPGSTAPALVGEGAAALSSGDAHADGPALVADHALEGAAVSATPATAHGSDVLADPAGPAFGPPLALPAAADPSAPVVGDLTSASAVGQPDPVAAAAPDLGLGSALHDLSATSSPGAPEPLWSTSDSALAMLAEVAPDPRVLVSAAVLALAGAALIGPRTGGSGTDLSMAMTNVRLLPCVLKASLERHVSMLVVAVGANGGSLQAGGSQFETGRVLGVFDDAFGSLRDGFGSLRDGFGRVILDARDEAEEGTGDNRLMIALAILLGLVQLAFLSVWLWLTRARY
jgi:hypothetical protein